MAKKLTKKAAKELAAKEEALKLKAKKSKDKAKAKGQPKKEAKKAPKKEPKKSKVSKAVSQAVEGDDWDETTGSGGDYFKLKTGKHIGRIRSVISCGQVQFTFQKVLDDKATSALAFIIEVWSYKIKKGKVVITSKEPAIVNHVMKALKGNPKANYTKTKKALGIKTPDQFKGMAVQVELFTSDKGYMYIQGALGALGLAESKAVPKCQHKGFSIPNLDMMTKEAMLELNPITQVKDYVLKAVNLEGTEAERIIQKIRKKKPEYARLKSKPDEKSKGKAKGKKAKLSKKAKF